MIPSDAVASQKVERAAEAPALAAAAAGPYGGGLQALCILAQHHGLSAHAAQLAHELGPVGPLVQSLSQAMATRSQWSALIDLDQRRRVPGPGLPMSRCPGGLSPAALLRRVWPSGAVMGATPVGGTTPSGRLQRRDGWPSGDDRWRARQSPTA